MPHHSCTVCGRSVTRATTCGAPKCIAQARKPPETRRLKEQLQRALKPKAEAGDRQALSLLGQLALEPYDVVPQSLAEVVEAALRYPAVNEPEFNIRQDFKGQDAEQVAKVFKEAMKPLSKQCQYKNCHKPATPGLDVCSEDQCTAHRSKGGIQVRCMNARLFANERCAECLEKEKQQCQFNQCTAHRSKGSNCCWGHRCVYAPNGERCANARQEGSNFCKQCEDSLKSKQLTPTVHGDVDKRFEELSGKDLDKLANLHGIARTSKERKDPGRQATLGLLIESDASLRVRLRNLVPVSRPEVCKTCHESTAAGRQCRCVPGSLAADRARMFGEPVTNKQVSLKALAPKDLPQQEDVWNPALGRFEPKSLINNHIGKWASTKAGRQGQIISVREGAVYLDGHGWERKQDIVRLASSLEALQGEERAHKRLGFL